MDNINLDKKKCFTIEELDEFLFFQIPKSLMNKKYDELRFESKFLYGILFERTKLSKKKGWYDDEGRAFIYFEKIEAADMFKIGEKKVIALFKALREFNLIYEVSEGKGTKNRIYVLRSALKETYEDNREYRKSKDIRKERRLKEAQKNINCQNEGREIDSQKGSQSTVKKDVTRQSKRQYSNKDNSNKDFSNNNNSKKENLENNQNNKKEKDVVVVSNNFSHEATDKNIKELQVKWINTLKVHLKPGLNKNVLIVDKNTMEDLIKKYSLEKINRYLDNHNGFKYKSNPTGFMLKAIKNDWQYIEVKTAKTMTEEEKMLAKFEKYKEGENP